MPLYFLFTSGCLLFSCSFLDLLVGCFVYLEFMNVLLFTGCRFSFIEGVGLVGFLLLLLLSEVAVISRIPLSILCLGLCLVLMSAWTYSCLEWCTFLDWIYGVSLQLWSFNQSINQYLFQTAYITLSHSRYKIDIGYSLGWHQRYETCQGCNPLKFHESDIYI